MRSSFWTEPLAEKVIFATKNERLSPVLLGGFVRLAFVVAVVLAGVFYYLQDIPSQKLEDLPVNENCRVLGSIAPKQSLVHDVTYERLLYTLEGQSDPWLSNPQNCRNLFNQALNNQYWMSEMASPVDMNMQLFLGVSDSIKDMFVCLFQTPGCTTYTIQQLQNIKGSTAALYCGASLQRDFDMSGIVCTDLPFPAVSTKHSPSAADIVQVRFFCNGTQQLDLPLTLLPDSNCYPGNLKVNYTKSVATVCDNLPKSLGPYLCPEITKRPPLDIINLAFAAGSATVIVTTLVAAAVHRLCNGRPVDEGRKMEAVQMTT